MFGQICDALQFEPAVCRNVRIMQLFRACSLYMPLAETSTLLKPDIPVLFRPTFDFDSECRIHYLCWFQRSGREFGREVFEFTRLPEAAQMRLEAHGWEQH